MRKPATDRLPAPEPRELPDALLDLVVGGAGDLPPTTLQRLLQDGVLRTPNAAPSRP